MADRKRLLIWTRHAHRDFEDILQFLDSDSPMRARLVMARILARVESLKLHPWRGRQVPELRVPWLRETIVAPWRVLYMVEDDSIVVLAILHGARDFRSPDGDP